jgi:acetoin utilization protein AcuB
MSATAVPKCTPVRNANHAWTAPTMRDVMTPSPHSIGKSQPLAMAHARMRALGVRHLPVLDGGKLQGLVSQRDLYLIETLAGTDPKETFVFEAMSIDVLVASPDDKLEDVARSMNARKCGSAVILENGHVVGIFTTTDALALVATWAHGD